jgi:hypothetical protein
MVGEQALATPKLRGVVAAPTVHLLGWKVGVEELVVDHRLHDVAGYLRVIEGRVDADQIVLCVVATQAKSRSSLGRLARVTARAGPRSAGVGTSPSGAPAPGDAGSETIIEVLPIDPVANLLEVMDQAAGPQDDSPPPGRCR